MTARRGRKDDRLFVRDGRRNHRRRFSLTEVRLGLGVLALLALVAVWVGWRGANPDPALFEIPPELLDAGVEAVDRGPLPEDLAPKGWREDRLSAFDDDNLYVKINGREDYYKSFGFERLWFLSIVEEGADAAAPPRIVDVELFDLGSAPNALGAYAGERPPEVVPSVDDNGMYHTSENALFMTRGRYYVRAIGSDTGPQVHALLSHLAERLAGMSGEPLPWGYALFVGALGLDPGRVSFMAENAFSFGFARNVYAARLDDDTEIFVVAVANDAGSRDLAEQFAAGFLAYGERVDAAAGSPPDGAWVRDRYLNKVSGAASHGTWVVGVRGAPELERARAALETVTDGVRALPEAVVRQAAASAADAATGEGEAEGSPAGASSDAPAEPVGDDGYEEYKEGTPPGLESDPSSPEN